MLNFISFPFQPVTWALTNSLKLYICALAAPGDPWHLTFAPRKLKNLSVFFFIEIIHYTGQARFLQAQSTGFPFTLIGAKPCSQGVRVRQFEDTVSIYVPKSWTYTYRCPGCILYQNKLDGHKGKCRTIFNHRLHLHYAGQLFMPTRKAIRYSIKNNGPRPHKSFTHIHTSNIMLAWLANRVWCTTFQSSLMNIYFCLSRFQSLLPRQSEQMFTQHQSRVQKPIQYVTRHF